ncbi:MAG: MFS transporter [Elusimicrobiota bacterium]
MKSIKKNFWGELGRDFWLYRLGQAISISGDVCSSIALSWWILEKTGSAAKLATIMSPAMMVSVFLLPLLGPLGDKFSRRKLILIGDGWRAIFTLMLAAMAYYDIFNVCLLVALYIMLALGTAFYRVGASSIVPQLVPPALLGRAIQQSQAISSTGTVLGGVVGGVLVTGLGISGAFLIDGISYVIAVAATFAIVVKVMPVTPIKEGNPVAVWMGDVKDGFRMVYKIPVRFWLSILAAFLNFAIAPMNIALPVLVKEARNMPPWFLGALASSRSLGVILAALLLGWISKKIYQDVLLVLSIITIGLGIIAMPWTPNIFLPPLMMFFIGAAFACFNISVSTQDSLALPDNFRARAGAITSFMCHSTAPLGNMLGGILIAIFGLNMAMTACGLAVSASACLLFLVPKFSEFYRLPPEKATVFFKENYPDAFN